MANSTLYHQIESIMSSELAEKIRQLRVIDGYSWRAVAREIYDYLEDPFWDNPESQPIGMDLCDVAMEYLDEDIIDGWN